MADRVDCTEKPLILVTLLASHAIYLFPLMVTFFINVLIENLQTKHKFILVTDYIP